MKCIYTNLPFKIKIRKTDQLNFDILKYSIFVYKKYITNYSIIMTIYYLIIKYETFD